MRYKLLGHSGLRVSELCLGTMTFGEVWGWGSNKDESRAVFDAFLEAGGNFVDTANFYTDGTSETYLGEFLRGRREEVVLATKYTDSGPTRDPNRSGNHRKNMVQSLDASLKRLGTDYVDVYQVHSWDFLTPVEEVMRALDDMVRSGRVLYVGISDTPAWIISQANTLARLMGWSPFIVNQIGYSLVERTAERELGPMSRALDIGLTAWSPLAAGLLSGKYTGGEGSEPKRLDVAPMVELSERNLHIAREVDTVAKELGRTPAQVALNWVRHEGIIPIFGARHVAQLHENLGCLDFTLGEGHRRRLDEVSRVDPGFPVAFLSSKMGRDAVYGGMFGQIDTHRPNQMPREWLGQGATP